MQDREAKNQLTNVPEQELDDLPVADEEAEQARGGALSRNNPFDDNSHGTHVSGTIGSTG